jgi:general secretion pathway protein C
MLGMRIAAFLRQNGWVLNLVFIALGAYFVAGAFNAVLARSIRVVPSADEVSPQHARAPHMSVQHERFTTIAERNLLAAKREVIGPVATTAAAPETILNGCDYEPNAVTACTLTVNVRATLVADGAPEWSMAVLLINNENAVYSINDGSNRITDDATLCEVADRSIIVRRRDHFERCLAETEGTAPPTMTAMVTNPPPGDSAPPSPNPEDTSGVTKVGETQYNVARAEIDQALGNLSTIATQARIVPSFKNGKANGFKLFSIKPGSIYSKIGLQNGDVIQKINGYEMDSPDKALELYQKLKDTTSVSIELQRRGQTMNMSYNIGG